MTIVPASGRNWGAEVAKLRQAGYTLPNSPVQARVEARQVADSVSRGSLAEAANRRASSDMRRRRLASQRNSSGTSPMVRTAGGSNLEMALPKIRQPLGSLMDKGVPFNIQDPKELIELRRWCRLFYSTHDLIPLLVDIYSKFPVTGLEFQCKDPAIERVYSEMFLNDLNYEEFLPDSLLREYFIVGEVTSLAHFNEQLGVWSSEEILNPDMLRVSKSMFVDQERIQLVVKELVESLRDGPQGAGVGSESPSERMQRQWEYENLVRNYPEMVHAASQDDGLDISDALVSRLVNRAQPSDNYGTPIMLRSFRMLMMEESLNAAQDAVADRLYSPLILATLGVENLGDGEPWIPDESDLDDFRDDMQQALAADFKLLVHNFGVNVQNVFGRESVPRFDQDYDRIDQKLLQAWGIGQALIMGGASGGGTYASSALNREVCEQLMKSAQRKVIRHIRKRMEVVAEAQQHYDYELEGGRRVPIYREVVETDPETGEDRIVRVPKLLIPEVKFSTLNLRDESQERAFIAQLKQMGVPISDGTLAVNIPIKFKEELEREAQETIDKGLATAQAFKVLQDMCDREGLPYPQELVMHLTATLQLRQQLAATDMAEDQAKMTEQQMDAMSPAGQMGILPQQGGGTPQPAPPQAGAPQGGDPTGAGGPGPVGAPPEADADVAGGAPPVGTPDPGMPSAMPSAGTVASRILSYSGPKMMPPTIDGPAGGNDIETPSTDPGPMRNFSRPEESDEMRAGAPKSARFAPPSSYGTSRRMSPERVDRAVQRRALLARHSSSPMMRDLVADPDFYRMLNMGAYERQIQADYPEVVAGAHGYDDSRSLLQEMAEQYEDATGARPVWD